MPPPRRHRHQREYTPHRRRSLYADDPDFPSDSTLEDPYYMDDKNPLHGLHARNSRRPYSYDDSDLEPNASFSRVSVKLPSRTASLLPDSSILILPPNVTHMRIRLNTPTSSSTLHATVAGDMSFRDVVRQLVPNSHHHGEVRAQVKLRGTWVEPGARVRVSELVEQGRFVMNEGGEVEVRIEIVGIGGNGEGRRVKGWERETGRAWEIRT
jgi:hypothetical protein